MTHQNPTPQQPYSQGPGQPGQPMQPAPQETKKKSKKLWWILGGVLLLIIIIAVASGGSDSESSSTDTSSTDTDSSKQEDAPEAGIGQSVRDGKFEFVVNGVERDIVTVGNEFTAEQAQGEFVIVNVTVTNIGDAEASFSADSQKLISADGKEFSSNASAMISDSVASGNTGAGIYDGINPGISMDYRIIFDVPAGTEISSIKLHDSMFSGGVGVALN